MVLQFLPRIWIHMEKNEKRYIPNYCQLLKSKKDMYTNYKSIYIYISNSTFLSQVDWTSTVLEFKSSMPFPTLHVPQPPSDSPLRTQSHRSATQTNRFASGWREKSWLRNINIENWIFLSTSPQPKKICISDISKNLALQFNCSPG